MQRYDTVYLLSLIIIKLQSECQGSALPLKTGFKCCRNNVNANGCVLWVDGKERYFVYSNVLVICISKDSGNKAIPACLSAMWTAYNYQFVWKRKPKHAKHYRDTHSLKLYQLSVNIACYLSFLQTENISEMQTGNKCAIS